MTEQLYDLARRLGALPADKRKLFVARLEERGIEVGVLPIVAATRPERIPLSTAQQRLWIADQLEPDAALYNLTTTLRLRGPLDRAALARALDGLVARHEALRTGFLDDAGTPYQVIQPAAPFALAFADLAHDPDRERTARQLAAADAATPFVLATAPLLRARLVALGAEDHRLILTMHHLISDEWSNTVLIGELIQLYSGAALPALAVQYADYALWQRAWLDSGAVRRQLAYWEAELGRAPYELALPGQATPAPSSAGAAFTMTLPRVLKDRLAQLARRADATLFMAVLAGYQIVLARSAGQDEIRVGVPIANRHRPEVDGVVGFFSNTQVLRGTVRESDSALALLARVRRTVLEAQANQDLPFERVVEVLQPERQAGRNPLFEVMLSWHRAEATSFRAAGGLTIDWEVPDEKFAKFDLCLHATDAEDGIGCELVYRTQRFAPAAIAALGARLAVVLEAMCAAPERPLAELAWLAAHERAALARWSTAEAQPAQRPLHASIAEHALRTPEAIALVGDEQLTYGALEARANHLAARLIDAGVQVEDRVALVLPRSCDFVIALYAVWKCGAAYVPLDPAQPVARLAALTAGCRAIVGAGGLAPDRGVSDARIQRDVPLTAAAYVMYTSGSTGTPKGVVVSHGNLASYVDGLLARLALPAGARMAMVSTVAADLGNTTLFGALGSGAPLHLISEAEAFDADAMSRRMAEVDVLKIVPSHLRGLLTAARPAAVLPRHTLIVGGEATDAALLAQVTALGGCRIVNHYGPTETTVGVLTHAYDGDGLPLGLPLPGRAVHVLGAALAPVPPGVVGEIYVGGAGVARGYLDQPAETAARFVPDPFGPPGARLYRTGDRARRRGDGRIEFLGRGDGQIKLRGFRIELGEIRAALRAASSATAVQVLVSDGASPQLIAYLEGAPDEGVRARVAEGLPAHMVPAELVWLERFPVTANGKLDTRALAATRTARVEQSIAPRSELEGVLARAWCEALERDAVGVHDNFFQLGGDSLLAFQVVASARAAGLSVAPRDLFEHQTVAALAAALADRAAAPATAAIARVARGGALPASFAQERLWLLWRLEPDSAAYHAPTALRLRGTLDVPALEAALRALAVRHEILRTRLVELDGVVHQVIDDAVIAIDRDQPIDGFVARPFDLAAGPAWRAQLIGDGEDHVLLVVFHHVVSDGLSNAVLTRELARLYRGEAAEPLAIQYADYAAWQRAQLANELPGQLAYWQAQLGGEHPVLELPADRPRPAVASHHGASLEVDFAGLSPQLAALARAHDATPFMVLLAAFDVLLYRWTGQTDLRVGVPNANRPRRELEDLIGFFVNTQVLRTEVAPLESFAGLLARVKDATLGALAHQDLPFEQLVAALAPQRSLSTTPLFQVMFNHQHRDLAALAELPGLRVELVEVEPAVAQFDLTLDTWEVDGALHGAMTYATDLFDEATIARMIAAYLEILRAVVADAQTAIARLPVMPGEARAALMALAAGPQAARDPRCTHALIAEQIVRTPDRVAVTCRGVDLSYRTLGRRAAHLAHRLRALGVGPDALVGICLERSHDLIPSVLGVLQAGGAYLPLDPDYPRDRLAYMVGDAKPTVIVTEAHLADRLPEAKLCLLEPGEADAPADLSVPAHLAYCIYTSGSTGRPKGAIIPHAALVTHLVAMRANLRATADDRMLAIAPFSFDIATLELLLPLTVGARVVLAERAEALDPALLLARVRTDGVTIMQGTPTTWRMATGDASAAASLANVRALSGGEYMPPDLAQKIVALTGGLCNSYGPTETTIYSSSAQLHAGFLDPVIGSPFASTTYHVLDAHLQPVPVGVPGELYIGGPLLARGYLERPALTAEKFIPDPFGSGARLYRSGDVVSRRVDGELDFIRRADHQIKLRGFRIELGEIEARLLTDPNVHAAAVILRTDGEPQLVAYVVPKNGELDIAALQAHLRAQLPEFMVPAWFVALPALPRTANGKLDVRALPAPDVSEAQATYTAPRTALEQTVAAIWADALGVERVGLDDDFFALGGHSLLAARVTARVLRELGATVPLRALFEAARLRDFAARVAGELGVATAAPIPVADRAQPLPLSFAQERQWFLWRLEPGSAAYHLPAALALTGPLDRAALAAAFVALAARHEVLRTHFAADGSAQIIGAPAITLAIEEGTDRIAADAAQPFDLARGPLWRARLYRRAANEHVLLVVMHHAIADEVSLQVLIDELRALYRGEALPPLAIQYADYAAWQRRWLTGDELARQLAYWTAQLGDHHPVLELPADRARPAAPSGRGAAIELALDADLLRALRRLAHARGASLFMVLLAAFDVLLYRVTGQRDVRVGVPSANRSRVELERLVGFFINTHVLRAELAPGDAFTALLAQVRERVLGAQAHAELPFERLVEALRPERSLAHSPLFQVLFNHLEAPAAAEQAGELAITAWPLAQRTAQFELSVDTATRGDGLAMTWTYATDLFDAGTIAALAASYRQLLAAIAAAPDTRIDRLALLDGEAQAARAAWNATARDHQLERGFAERFEARVAQTPDRVAARCSGREISYLELARRARRVAHGLRDRGVAIGEPVGVLAERGLDHLALVTGVLLAGGVYVALDVRHPDERTAQIVAASGARVVLRGVAESASDAPLPLASHPQQLAYVIYTSGSTGTPKGAMVTLAGMLNNQLSKVPYLALTEHDVIAQTAAPSFDISVWQMLTGLLCGAIVEIVPDDIAGDPRALLAHVRATGITILESVPALIGEMLREPAAPLPLRYLLPTGEALPPALARQWLRRYPHIPLVNAYGPAECADDVALCTIRQPPTDELRMPIGRPTDNNQLHVLDHHLAPVPVGAIGQLAVSGVGVGHGYVGDPARTAEVFVPAANGERRYLTGDLARHRADGTLEYVGRVDHQIKLRGQRIELGEIEARLLELPGVTAAAVALRDQHLIGYVVTAADLAALRARLAEVLPAAMVPSQLVVLDALPLNPNGKLDRAALPAPAQLAVAYRAPHTPLEHDVAQIWADALGVAQVGRDDHFFDLGGHSLLATRITSQIERTLGIAVPLRALFEAPTLAAFTARVAASAPSARADIPSADRTRPLPLSFAQERQWFLWRLAPESSAYHIPLVAHLRGALDRAALARAFATLAARHEALRTRFVEQDGRVHQIVDSAAGAPVPELERGDDLARVLARPFDLTRGPAWRTALHRVADDHHVLAVVLHHIAADEVSLRVLMDELAAAYAGEALPPPALHYADYAAWQRIQALDDQLAYWTAQLGSDHGLIELPTDRPRPPVASGRGGLHPLGLDAELTAGLRRLARAHDATLFMVLLAAYDALLYRLTGQTDVRVGVPHANRPRAELERVIGCFINTHVLRAQVAPARDFAALLGHVKDVALGAQAHADLPFEQLVEALQPPRSLAHNPLFQVMFNFLAGERDRSAVLPGLVMTPYDHERTTTQVDLALDLWEDGDGLAGALIYASDLFDDATAARFAALYAELLRAVVASAATPIALLPLLPAADRAALTVTLAADAAADLRCTHALIAEQIVRTPDRVAVTHRGVDLSYRTLGRRAAHLAHRLRALGVGPDALVGICLERSHELIPSVLGVLQAGGAYLPLDPDYPRDRLAYMVGDAKPTVIVTEAHLADRLPAATLCLLDPGEADDAPADLGVPAHLAYCIYTSGSTGRPKGALIPHAALVAHLVAMRANLRATADDRMLAIAPFSFDIATLELLLPLTVGARVVLAERPEALDPALLLARVRADGVTIMQGTPTTWRMATGDPSAPASLANVRALSGGEYMPPDLAQKIVALTGGLCNSYGPTETTIYSSSAQLHAGFLDPVIGAPFARTTYHVLDAYLQPVPVGVPGELYIGGPLLARGYLDRPDLTAEKFLPDPSGSGARLYRSGDIVRRRVDGELDFIRRADHQIKLRGFRIELGEIEARLLADPSVHAAAVILRTDGEPQLVAYVVPKNGELDIAALQAHLRAQLPEFMVPAWFVPLPALPRTANGKLDVRALPAPDRREALARYTAPRSQLEATLAAIWADALGVDRVGLDDDFFALGGHSLLATRVAARVLRDLGKQVPLRTVFEASRLRDFAARVQALAATNAAPIALRDRRLPAPLSYAQERQWFLWQLAPDTTAYHLPIAVTLTGAVDAAALTAAFAALTERHEALRTRFALRDGQPEQRFDAPAVLELVDGEPDLAALDAPFDLAGGPLWRARLHRRADDHVLVIVMHHAISDEASLRILVDELARLYTGEALAPLAIQYADHAAWQRTQALDDQLAYWTARLADDVLLELPTDRPRPAVASAEGATLDFALDAELTRGLVRLARAHDATLFMVLLAAFAALLYRLTGQRDLRVGVPAANRSRVELERVIGFFVNTHVLRAEVVPEASFTALLAQVREAALAAQAHPDVPFEQLVEALRPARSLSHNPIFQVMFNHLWQDRAQPIELPGLVLSPLTLPRTTTQVDLQLTTWEDGDAVRGAITYATALFDAASIERVIAQFTQLLQAVVATPAAIVARLPVAAAPAMIGPVEPLDPRSLPARVAAQIAATPDAIAVRTPRALSYRALGRRAAALAAALRARGVGPDTLVGLCSDRTHALVIGALGILLAGGAYVPLDPDYPRERIADMLADARPDVIVSDAAHAADFGARACVIEDDEADLALASLHPQHLAYCIYTSGSTGRPKGVALSHAAIGNFLDAMLRELPLTAADRVLAITPISFDIAGLELWLPLVTGATVVLADRATALDPAALLARIRDERVTVVQATPSTWRMIATHPDAHLLAGVRLLCGGEALPADLAAQLVRLSDTWNVYGPTETAVWSAIARVTGDVVLGAPLRNTTLALRDAHQQPVPRGTPAELYIGGDGLARGYWNRPDLTADRFVPAPGGQRVYRTGDRVRQRPNLEFLGRVDHQIKLRGHRIELGEIEARLLEQPGVRAAAAVLRDDRGDPRIVGYVVGDRDPAELLAALRTALPAYMVPAQLVALDALPRSPAGKLDRKALPAPDAPARTLVPPRDDLERQLVALWQDVLGLPAVGIHDGFFDLGGHSLSATRLASRIRADLAVELPLRVLFEATTVAELAGAIRAGGFGALSDAEVDDMSAMLASLESP